MSLNKVMLIGRLTRDPEMRYTPSGQPVTSFGLATNRYASGPDGDRREFTDFHNIVCWNIGRRNLAEIVAQYTRKGAQVYVEGRLSTRSWEGQDGQKRSRTEVVANDVQFLDTRGGGLSLPRLAADVPLRLARDEVAEHGLVDAQRGLQLGDALRVDVEVGQHVVALAEMLHLVGQLAPPPHVRLLHLATEVGQDPVDGLLRLGELLVVELRADDI